MPADLTAQYAALVASGEIERDLAQEAVLDRLAMLDRRLMQHRLARKSSSLGWLFGARERREEPIRGLYIFGEVGRGKTMLMDLFFAASRVVRKRRVHFHEFMGDVHERVGAIRRQQKNGAAADDDPIRLAAAAIAEESWLLCFDEFNVTDIADAMILGRLFRRLFELGVVVVATSNVAPGELYRDGLNRALFVPFIVLIEHHMEVAELSARADFRLENLAGQPVWHVPADAAATAALDEAWRRLTGGPARRHAQDLHLLGAAAGSACRLRRRAFRLRRALRAAAGGGRLSQDAHEFHTHPGSHPVMDYEARNEAKRFIILIDTFYDNGEALGFGGGRARHALSRPRRFRGARVQAHGVAPDRDAFAILPGAAARPAGFGRQPLGPGRDRGNLSGNLKCQGECPKNDRGRAPMT